MKITLLQGQSRRSGWTWPAHELAFPATSGWLYTPKLKQVRMEGRKFFPYVDKAGKCKSITKRGKYPRHKGTGIYAWNINSNGLYFQLFCFLLR